MAEIGREFAESTSNLTIFILTFNRPRALARQLYNLRNFPGQVIVLDGGEYSLENSELQAKPNNLFYIREKTFQKRFEKAAERLSTGYAMTFSDDDVLVPTGINQLLEVISLGKSESVFGRTAYAFPLKNSWGISTWSPLYDSLDERKVLASDSESRIIRHFSSYSCVYFYSIMTADAWKNTFSIIKLPDENMMQNPYALELAYEFMGALAARSEIYNVLAAVRVKDFKPTWLPNEGKENRSLLMSEWLYERKFENAVTHYKTAIINAARAVSKELDAERVTEAALLNFCSRESMYFRNRANSQTRRKFLTKSNAKIALDVLLIKLGFTKQVSNLKSARIYRELISQGIQCDRHEIESIILCLFIRQN